MPWKPDYVTDDDLAHYVSDGTMDADQVETQSGDLARAVTAASRAVDDAANRQYGSVAAEAREYTLTWSVTRGMWYAEVDDFMSVAGWVIAWDSASDGTYATVVDVAKTIKSPRTAAREGKPWERIYFRSSVSSGFNSRYAGLRVTLPWGWTSVPKTVEQATLLQGSRFFNRRNSPYGVAGSPADGSEMRLLARADPDVKVMLKDYARRTWAR